MHCGLDIMCRRNSAWRSVDKERREGTVSRVFNALCTSCRRSSMASLGKLVVVIMEFGLLGGLRTVVLVETVTGSSILMGLRRPGMTV